jgi:hypothetical protein
MISFVVFSVLGVIRYTKLNVDRESEGGGRAMYTTIRSVEREREGAEQNEGYIIQWGDGIDVEGDGTWSGTVLLEGGKGGSISFFARSVWWRKYE